MHIIIDGYNLLFSSCQPEDDRIHNSPVFSKKNSLLEQARNKLIILIKTFYQSRNDRITIVFDGATSQNECTKEQFLVNTNYLTVLFSDKNASADDLIIKIATNAVSESEVLVITSDNGIKQRLKSEGPKVVSSSDFMSMLISSSSKTKSQSFKNSIKDQKKLFGISPEEAEKWMDIFGFESEDFSGKPN